MFYSNATSGAVLALERLLITRRECCVDTRSISGSPPRTTTGSDGRYNGVESRAHSSVPMVDASWEANNHNQRTQQLLPHNAATPASRPSSVYSRRSDHSTHSQSQQRAPIQIQNRTSSQTSPSPLATNMYESRYDSQIPSNIPYAQQQFHFQNLAQQRSTSYQDRLTIPAPINVNSCAYATDMITTMAGGDPMAVRADLGCLPGMDCEVDNQLVFNVMDRYNVGL